MYIKKNSISFFVVGAALLVSAYCQGMEQSEMMEKYGKMTPMQVIALHKDYQIHVPSISIPSFSMYEFSSFIAPFAAQKSRKAAEKMREKSRVYFKKMVLSTDQSVAIPVKKRVLEQVSLIDGRTSWTITNIHHERLETLKLMMVEDVQPVVAQPEVAQPVIAPEAVQPVIAPEVAQPEEEILAEPIVDVSVDMDVAMSESSLVRSRKRHADSSTGSRSKRIKKSDKVLLIGACAQGDVAQVCALLDAGVDINCVLNIELAKVERQLKSKQEMRITPLIAPS